MHFRQLSEGGFEGGGIEMTGEATALFFNVRIKKEEATTWPIACNWTW
jgi:hypothetical protein